MFVQNESKRHRLEHHTQGGEKNAQRLCKRMVEHVGFGRKTVLERSSISQNQRNRRPGQVLLFASIHYILA
jgi:hypothetical protein